MSDDKAQTPADRDDRRRMRSIAICVAALAFALRIPALTASFSVFDDPLLVTSNARILSGTFLELWSPRAALEGRFCEYFPLRDTVYWLVARVTDGPALFHAAVILFHSIASALVVACARALELSPRACAIAGVLFATHPAHTESAAWVSGLKDSMVLTFLLGAFLAYVGFDARRRVGDLLLAASLLVAALLCKSAAIVFPGIVFAHALWLSRPPAPSVPRRVLLALVRSAPFLAIVLVFLVAIILPVAATNDIVEASPLSAIERVLLASWLVVRYATLALAPFHLRIWHIDTFVDHISADRVVALVAFWLAFAILVGWSARTERRLAFCASWFVFALVPVLNLISFGAVFADRYVYGASVGSCVAISIGLERALSSRALWIVSVAIAITFASLSLQRGLMWRRESLLWLEVVEDDESARYPQPWMMLAESYKAAGDAERAAETFARALAVSRSSPQPLSPQQEIHCARAGAELALDAARFDLALSLARDLAARADDAASLETLARALAANGDASGAERAARAGLARASLTPSQRWNLALHLGATPEAAAHMQMALAADRRLCPVYDRWKSQAPVDLVSQITRPSACE